MTRDLLRAVQEAVDAAVLAYHQDLEAVCEAALQTGEHGVLVTWRGAAYTIEVSPAVPWGTIHEHRETC